AKGSGGNGNGIVRTIRSRVSSVSSPDSRSSITRPPNREAPTPRPVYPAEYATCPPYAVVKNGKNREHVSIAPPHLWVKRIPSSWGNVSTNWRASFSNVSGRWSYFHDTCFP